MKKLFSIMSNLQTHYHFKLDFQKVDMLIMLIKLSGQGNDLWPQ